MRRGSAALFFLGGLAVVLVVAGVTFAVVQALGLDEDDAVAAGDDPTVVDPGGPTPTTEPELVLAEDQVEITGVAVGLTVEGSTLERIETPLVVTVPEPGAGAGATLFDVEVDGLLSEVVWDGGRPFDLEGVGGIVPGSLNLFAAPTSITVGFVDGVANQFVPGSYGLETPIAVGRDGLAQAQGAVAFRATVESTVVFRGGARTSMLPRELQLEASGRVLIEGELEVRRADGVSASATIVELPAGAYRVEATPRRDATGYDVTILLQGDITVT